MGRTSFWLLCLVLLVLLSCEKTEIERSPNIVIIFADDLGYGDLGCYGHPTIRTPHLDQMAAEGMRFTQFYSGASVCTPSRAALLTGRLPVRFGCASSQWRVFFPFSKGGIPQSEITLAEALKDEGYATAIFGKWHLGHYQEFLPLQNGFDEYYGIPYSNDMSAATSPWITSRAYPKLPLVEGNQTIKEEPDQRFLTEEYTSRAVDFIRRKKKEPFFLYYPHTFPHIPLFANEKFEGKSSRGLYGDVVEEIDWSVGQILSTLKEEGLADNTLVVFTSDNGPWLTVGADGGSAGLLHQGKGSTYEGGMREPAIFWWPGSIASGKVSQELATTMDIFHTAISVAGASLPNDRVYDGVDISALLFSEGSTEREMVFYYLGDELFAIRKGPWKMHYKTLNPYIGEKAVEHDPPLLYNLEVDPSERFNVAAEQADVLIDLEEEVANHKTTLKSDVTDQLTILDTVMMAQLFK